MPDNDQVTRAILVRTLKRLIELIERGAPDFMVVNDIAYLSARACELTTREKFEEDFDKHMRSKQLQLEGFCKACERNLAGESGLCSECERENDIDFALALNNPKGKPS